MVKDECLAIAIYLPPPTGETQLAQGTSFIFIFIVCEGDVHKPTQKKKEKENVTVYTRQIETKFMCSCCLFVDSLNIVILRVE